MDNLLKNAGFAAGMVSSFDHWKVPYGIQGVISVHKQGEEKTGLFQDVDDGRFKSDGTYSFRMRLLALCDEPSVNVAIWVFRDGEDSTVEDHRYRLKQGQWQIVEVRRHIARHKLKKVRVEIYLETLGEYIVKEASFNKV